MTLFFDTKVQFLDLETISTICVFHPNEPLFAIASFGQERGGSVTIFEDSGEPLRNISFPVHPVSQATALSFHPEKQLLLSGWENGEIHAWINGRREFIPIQGSGFHKSPIMLIEFSEKGGRLVTADSNGTLTGWRVDHQGQFLTMFSHDLRDPLLYITFRKTVENSTSTELTNLAKLAVSGDEVALDTLTNWRPRTAARSVTHSGVKDNHCFYVGSQSGILFYINQTGTCTEVLRTDNSPIIQILWHPKRDAIVSLMQDMTVGHYLVESNGNLTELDRVKLSSRISGYEGAISWAGNSLAIITGDMTVRIWDIDTSDNFLLPTDHTNLKNTTTNFAQPKSASSTETFMCIAYCSENQTLCAGTNQGNIYIWKKTNYKADSENGWQLSNISVVRGAIKQCAWGITEAMKPCILVNCISNAYILKEQPLMSFHTRDMWAAQKSANQIAVQHESGKMAIVNCDVSVTNLCMTDLNLIVTNGRSILVYKIQRQSTTGLTSNTDNTIKLIDENREINLSDDLNIKLMNSFNCECVQIFIYEQNIICLNQNDIKILSLNGVKLQEIQFSENEGKPIGADLTGKYLTVFTMNGYIKIYDVSRHDPKLIVPSKCAYDLFPNFGEVIMAKCNINGTILALTIATENLIPDGKFYMWDIETDSLYSYDFLEKNKSNDLPRLPIIFYWDTDDHRLIACEARLIQQGKQKHKHQAATSTDANHLNISESVSYIMFLCDKSAIKELEIVNLSPGEQLVNLCAPHVITLKTGVIGEIPLRDFKGLEKCDSSTRKMVLDFSLNLAQGDMDKAFSCIRSLQSETVWMNLAKMCVQTGQNLDVAKVCLGHLKLARSVRALRMAMTDNTLEQEAKTAVLAIELGMIDEAENLYKKCGRYDLLNNMLQAAGRFEEALKIAEQCDRVHLKNTYFKYAEWLRENGENQEALKYFEKSSNPTHNVTQMLMDDPIALRKYMQNTNDTNMLKWYAQYIESTGDMESAFKIYQKAEDWFSQVRILCFLGQLSKADSIARHSGDRSACYHLARHYENIGKFQDAIQFYTRAQTYGNAVRICKENDLQDELWTVANSARARDKASAAAFFEEVGNYKRAVELYHRAGMLHKAVEMAFASEQPETLQVIASELDANSDPELIDRCAEFFQSINLHHKAVVLLANARQLDKAVAVCAKHGVPITETLAEMLTPNKDEVPEEKRIDILITIGDILQVQGDYHLATKKFTQAGDKIRAMKSLLKSGDTEKIVFFAGMSRQKEIYIMAANYLQAMDWQNDEKTLKNIVTFYTKGGAYDLLANFYAMCAQAEVDEYRDYEKGLKALQEAAKCLSKISPQHSAMEQIQESILELRKFLELQELSERREFNTVIIGCKNMLTQKEKLPIRHGDILGMLVEAQISSKQYSDALATLRELALKQPDWSSKETVDRSLIERLAFECGIEFNILWNSGRRQLVKQSSVDQTDVDEESDAEEIEEEVDP